MGRLNSRYSRRNRVGAAEEGGSVTNYLETLILRNGGKMPKKGG